MSSILNEYVHKKLDLIDLQNEIQAQIKAYNNATGRDLFLYAADINKARIQGVDVSLVQDDFYMVQDILRDVHFKKIDFYIETPGGSGEAAEEIAKFLRDQFDEVNFVIAGEAKSAGTILALSGDNIYMTKTGSLGPIDAQVRIGRSVVSAHDYKEWVEEKRKEAANTGSLNPFDAIMVAQISPGELYGVINSLEFAKDLVSEWLAKYKFKDWVTTEGDGKAVTKEMKIARAKEIAEKLCNHTTWRTHGRSLKIADFDGLLKIENLDTNRNLAEIVYRIKTLVRLLFESTTMYKIYYMADFNLGKNFAVASNSLPRPSNLPGQKAASVQDIEINVDCPQCKKKHNVPAYIGLTSAEIKAKKLKINDMVSENDVLTCDNCSFSLDLKPIKNQIENQFKKKINLR